MKDQMDRMIEHSLIKTRNRFFFGEEKETGDRKI